MIKLAANLGSEVVAGMFANNFISNVVMFLIFSKYKNSNFSEIL